MSRQAPVGDLSAAVHAEHVPASAEEEGIVGMGPAIPQTWVEPRPGPVGVIGIIGEGKIDRSAAIAPLETGDLIVVIEVALGEADGAFAESLRPRTEAVVALRMATADLCGLDGA